MKLVAFQDLQRSSDQSQRAPSSDFTRAPCVKQDVCITRSYRYCHISSVLCTCTHRTHRAVTTPSAIQELSLDLIMSFRVRILSSPPTLSWNLVSFYLRFLSGCPTQLYKNISCPPLSVSWQVNSASLLDISGRHFPFVSCQLSPFLPLSFLIGTIRSLGHSPAFSSPPSSSSPLSPAFDSLASHGEKEDTSP